MKVITMAKTEAPTIDSLMEKGGGVLTKRGNVWTYPGAPNDPSGTNLKLPVESVPDGVVQDALNKGSLVAKVRDSIGSVVSVVYPAADGEPEVRVLSLAQAGTVEMATELPLNSRPTHDAGRRPGEVDVAVAQGKVDPKEPRPSGPIAPAVPVAAAQVAAAGESNAAAKS